MYCSTVQYSTMTWVSVRCTVLYTSIKLKVESKIQVSLLGSIA